MASMMIRDRPGQGTYTKTGAVQLVQHWIHSASVAGGAENLQRLMKITEVAQKMLAHKDISKCSNVDSICSFAVPDKTMGMRKLMVMINEA